MGPEASAANKALVAGRHVTMEKDVSENDRFGRLLRYVWLQRPEGWLMVNLELVRTGFAAVSTYPPDVKYVDLLLAAQRDAREAGAGPWGGQPEPMRGPAPRPGAGGRGGGGGGAGLWGEQPEPMRTPTPTASTATTTASAARRRRAPGPVLGEAPRPPPADA